MGKLDRSLAFAMLSLASLNVAYAATGMSATTFGTYTLALAGLLAAYLGQRAHAHHIDAAKGPDDASK